MEVGEHLFLQQMFEPCGGGIEDGLGVQRRDEFGASSWSVLQSARATLKESILKIMATVSRASEFRSR
jgi:hypothetical protein